MEEAYLLRLFRLRYRRVWVRVSILPDNQDLAIICQEWGIDVRSLRVNPYDPKTVAKPPQVPGKLPHTPIQPSLGTAVIILQLQFLDPD